jgi:hypothetical protein
MLSVLSVQHYVYVDATWPELRHITSHHKHVAKLHTSLIHVVCSVGAALRVCWCHMARIATHHITNRADKPFENVAQLRCLGTTLTHQNCMHEEIKRRLNLRDEGWHSFRNILSSRLPSEQVNITKSKHLILLLLCCSVTWSVICREQYGPWVFENRVQGVAEDTGSCTKGEENRI